MNGVHDLGGMQNFGPVAAEPDEPVFHADWERCVFAMRLAMGSWRRWNIDMTRWAIEQLPPVEYLSTSYYEHWFDSLLQLLDQPSPATLKVDRFSRNCGKRKRSP